MKTFLVLCGVFALGVMFDNIYLQHPGKLSEDTSAAAKKVSEVSGAAAQAAEKKQ